MFIGRYDYLNQNIDLKKIKIKYKIQISVDKEYVLIENKNVSLKKLELSLNLFSEIKKKLIIRVNGSNPSTGLVLLTGIMNCFYLFYILYLDENKFELDSNF